MGGSILKCPLYSRFIGTPNWSQTLIGCPVQENATQFHYTWIWRIQVVRGMFEVPLIWDTQGLSEWHDTLSLPIFKQKFDFESLWNITAVHKSGYGLLFNLCSSRPGNLQQSTARAGYPDCRCNYIEAQHSNLPISGRPRRVTSQFGAISATKSLSRILKNSVSRFPTIFCSQRSTSNLRKRTDCMSLIQNMQLMMTPNA